MGELVTGLDVGGAHLKAAQVAPSGRVVSAVQLPCALWQGLDRLELALARAVGQLAPIRRLAVTMTGELADLFPDRAAGVRLIVDATAAALPGADLRVWAGRRGFVGAADAPDLAPDVASANWLATAALVARNLGDALLVDLGSTTTDVLLLAGGEIRAEGTTDRERLETGELVYTGLTRTPVMALAAEAPFAGRRVALMNELFATAADVHRVLGWLPGDADQHQAADGGPKTLAASARRLARMVGADLADGGPADWRRLAAWLARAQLRRIEDAAALQLSRGLIPEDAPLVGAGCGRFLLEPLTRDLDRPYRDFAELVEAEPGAAGWAATCAPAVAVALLLAEVP
jgi:(4-(4-[2-(gamma-L-glutamylamino)ethyl]phenoxymethyl)furan-2-yl)methanamine synthase